MATKKITQRVADTLPPATALWDSEVKGFGVRRQRSDAVSFVLSFRTQDGRQRLYTIGKAGSPWTAETARKEALRLLGEVVKGDDPSAVKKERRNGMTVKELCEDYMQAAEKGLILNRQGLPKKASTIDTDRSRINAQIVPLLGSMKISSVKSHDVRNAMQAIIEGKTAKRQATGKKRGLSIVKGGKGAATRTMGLLGAILGWAVQQGHCTTNPCIGIRKPADGVRQRRMTDEEYAKLAKGLVAASMPAEGHKPVPAAAIAAARFLALTGWRRAEALTLRWDALDLSKRIAILADSKTGRSIRPLSTAVCDLLRSLPRQPNAVLVFPPVKGGEGATMSGFSKAFVRITNAAELPRDITPHVLRHSYASVAGDLGYSDATIATLIGHKGGGITRKYTHLADAVILSAADAVAGRISDVMSAMKYVMHNTGQK